MKKLMTGLLVFGLTTQFTFSKLIDSTCVNEAENYILLDTIDSCGISRANKFLKEQFITNFLLQSIKLNNEKDVFFMPSTLPEGHFDKSHTTEVKLLHTDEKIKNVCLQKKKCSVTRFQALS